MIDAGAENIEITAEYIEVYCAKEDFGSIQRKLEQLNIEPQEASLQRIPQSMVSLDNEQVKIVLKLIDLLEEDDDVQKVYHNLSLTDEQIAMWL